MSQLIQIIMNIPIAIAICILVVVLAAVIGPCGPLIVVTIKQFNRLLSTIPWPNALHSFLYRPFLIVSNTPLVALPSIPINLFSFWPQWNTGPWDWPSCWYGSLYHHVASMHKPCVSSLSSNINELEDCVHFTVIC